MRPHIPIVAIVAAVFTSTCAKRIPERTVAPGTPHISWVIMSGDRDNPDQDFVCQSDPRDDCVVPVSRPDSQVFSDVHVYYHGAGAETQYEGAVQIGFFQGSAESSRTVQTKLTVKKTESTSYQGVIGIVTGTPGTYSVDFALVATSINTGTSQPLREQVPVVVK